MNLRTQVAQLIRQMRKDSGLTQAQLVDLAGLSNQSRLSSIEACRMRNEPTFEEIERIASALNIEINITVTQKREAVVRKINV